MVLLGTAFVFGLLGSLHCLGMCAPLIWALPQDKAKKSKWWANRLAYNFGRSITYALLGVTIGLLGQTFALAGLQQYMSIIAGAVLLLILLFSKGHVPLNIGFGPATKLFAWVRSKMGRLIRGSTAGSNLMLGLLNGLLPCGLVYMALVAALSMGTIVGSGVYMMLFGLGTFPMMIAAAFLGSRIKGLKSGLLNRWAPRFLVVVSLLLIMRGLGLGIPYVSPAFGSEKEISICQTP
ncbi:sulfite exporter TauE/SafE family protein [Roseivirga pacifica]|uniref:sulfite exporter TauE/SafE family protein n=1 Tax=Roseivirga pacifica TaxID=1267423 RepID=UPI002094429C|nr:sulfite exporter TauE/SafE family protein [Roseivirga pacifica]MCO6357751.1 sulfite exporter TauE/SafE family protein [Roseivirga pacifica]MCO6366004.1 sulfite exporter TauE/SafE family protein [Roseivirga pacifica]MCO6371332.1 sulfite exporter TauE/SafE family protein [Roseivirga pacifica]MCO6375497.1 sulfite exporter TauE/SafE family protein [Roseivirga pacifica]MCO6378710.1 sulfite exporter TauE/SafE family protein [Roseivirga pacifica]